MMNRIQQIAHEVYGTNVLACEVVAVSWILSRFMAEEGADATARAQRKINAMRRERGKAPCYDIITPFQENN